jgi:ABC-2 type transport system permease protein
VFALASGITPTFRWLEMIPIVFALVAFATGIGMLLSALYVRYRDVQPIWEVITQAWFYCSPVMYVATEYGKRFASGFQHIALINPIATLLTQMGHTFIDPNAFPAAATVGGVVPVMIALAIIPATFALGWWVFTREAPLVAENL